MSVSGEGGTQAKDGLRFLICSVKKAWEIVGRKQYKERFLEELYETAEISTGLLVLLGSLAVETFRAGLKNWCLLEHRDPFHEACITFRSFFGFVVAMFPISLLFAD